MKAVQVSVGIWWSGVSLLAALWAVNRLGFVLSPESAEASLSAFVPVYSCTRRWHVYPEMSATVSGSPGRISRSSKQSIPEVTLYWDKEGARECWTTPHGCLERCCDSLHLYCSSAEPLCFWRQDWFLSLSIDDSHRHLANHSFSQSQRSDLYNSRTQISLCF